MINELPTIFDVVSGKSKTKAPTNNNHSNSKSKSNNKMVWLTFPLIYSYHDFVFCTCK